MIDIKNLLILQNQLNINTNGPEWIGGVSKNGRVINWSRCINMEAAEAIDSLNWKHWKDINGKNDWDNLKIEVVDIFHFEFSRIISDFGIEYGSELFVNEYEVYNKLKLSFPNKNDKVEEIILTLEKIQNLALNKMSVLFNLFKLVDLIDNFTLNDVEKLYIGKNCLNQFRQDHGYKEGTYVKIWDGKEDNVYVQEFLNNYNGKISIDIGENKYEREVINLELRDFLEGKYSKIEKEK